MAHGCRNNVDENSSSNSSPEALNDLAKFSEIEEKIVF